jgi:hypothetical protein
MGSNKEGMAPRQKFERKLFMGEKSTESWLWRGNRMIDLQQWADPLKPAMWEVTTRCQMGLNGTWNIIANFSLWPFSDRRWFQETKLTWTKRSFDWLQMGLKCDPTINSSKWSSLLWSKLKRKVLITLCIFSQTENISLGFISIENFKE